MKFPVRVNFSPSGNYQIYTIEGGSLWQRLYNADGYRISSWELIPEDARVVIEIMNAYLEAEDNESAH